MLMNTMILQVPIPAGLRELGYSDEEILREVPILLVLKRFRQRAVTSGDAARFLGLSRREFLDLLAREGIPLYDPSVQELERELETIHKLKGAER
jgi:predicted HTH domain antitoxin